VEDLLDGPFFDDLAGVHHRHPVTRLRDDPQIVGDHQHGHPQFCLEIVDQLQNLRLDRHVECGRRLVGDQQLRSTRQGDGDQHALPHPAGELVGVVVDPFGRLRDADLREHLDHPVEHRLIRLTLHRRHDLSDRVEPGVLTPAVELVKPETLGDLLADGQRGVERGHRVLEDHAHGAAAHVTHRRLRRGRQVDHCLLDSHLPDTVGFLAQHRPRVRLGVSLNRRRLQEDEAVAGPLGECHQLVRDGVGVPAGAEPFAGLLHPSGQPRGVVERGTVGGDPGEFLGDTSEIAVATRRRQRRQRLTDTVRVAGDPVGVTRQQRGDHVRRPECHPPASDLAGVVDEIHRRQRGDGLPRSRLADQPDRLPLPDRQVDAVDCLHVAPFGGELRVEIRHREEIHVTACRPVVGVVFGTAGSVQLLRLSVTHTRGLVVRTTRGWRAEHGDGELNTEMES